jgi:hypothetical protein
MYTIIKEAQKASNTKKTRLTPKAIQAGREHKTITLSFGAICRYIDKLNKQDLLEAKGFKPLAIEQINENGAFKSIRPLLSEKQTAKLNDPIKNIFGLTGLIYTANRIDKAAAEKAKIEAIKQKNAALTKKAIKSSKK